MSVAVISTWYNEELLGELFLRHYAWADRIYIFLDLDTSDRTAEMVDRIGSCRVHVQPFNFPDGMDDQRKIDQINDLSKELRGQFEWVLVADADEYIFHAEKTIPEYLETLAADDAVVEVPFWQVYRHRTDSPLTPYLSVLEQRQHGDPRAGICFGQKSWIKPSIVRLSACPRWMPGHHQVEHKQGWWQAREALLGCHWAMADADIAVERRIHGRKNRMSKHNFTQGFTSHNWHITEGEIRQECDQHLDDPQLFSVENGKIKITGIA